ncbi:MAG: EAL domain-containing protein [Mycobacteriales bacterium]
MSTPPVHVPRRTRGLSLRAKGAAVVLLPVLAMIGTLAGMVSVEADARRQDDAVTQTVDVGRATSRVLQLLVDAETGERGYVATGDRRLLEPEAAARAEMPRALRQVAVLLDRQVGSEPGGRALSAQVDVDLRQLEALGQLAPVREADRRKVAALIVDEKATTDDVRARISSLLAYEATRERASERARARSLRRANQLTGLLAAIGLFGGVGGSGLLMSRLVRRIRLVEGNARLLAQGQPLSAAAEVGADEIGSLARALEEAGDLIAAQRRRLQLALEVGRINVWELDADDRMRMHGDRASGYGPTLEAGLSTLRPADAALVRECVRRARADGTAQDYEVQSLLEARCFAGRVMLAPEGEVIAVSVDVTALRVAEQELRELDARLAREALAASERRGHHDALVISAAAEGIVAVDAAGVCTSANPTAARLLGCEVAELVGRDLHALCHHSRADGAPYPAEVCPMRRAAEHGEFRRVDDEVFWRRDGTRLPVAYSVSPLSEAGRLRGAVVTFSGITDRRRADAELEQSAAALRQGIRAGDMVLHYQPKVDLETGACAAVEALIRWQREDRLVYPDEFISVAERGGVISELTEWVVAQAALQAANWNATGLHLRVAVNLSALSLTDDHIVEVLRQAALGAKIPLSQLEVEITESAAAENPDIVVGVLAQLARFGVHTAIDDFGTGFSSLSYLKQLPISTLKIDKSFVMNMPQDTRDQAIVASTVHLAHSLGMTVVAEGVENDLVLRQLRHATCDTGQGYHWTRPVTADDLARWHVANRRR